MIKKTLTSFVMVGILALSSGQALASETGGSIDLTNAPLTNKNVSPFDVVKPLVNNVGGGTWDYGTSLTSWGTKKKVWSNYNHPSAEHRASCQIGTTYNSSDWMEAGTTARSSATGGLLDDTQAHWDKR